ncbi:MAG: DEAD/DEAH box helicase family protein [Tissierellia bacterium]|nr:DEAD/DEAH box helicase family protein [Tissierellia bacterium]
MSFQDLTLLPSYNTDDEKYNPARTFYNPVLSRAKTYKRVAGYFSSSSFAFIGKGLGTFIQNGGLMQFILNVQLLEDDYMNIRLGIESPETIIESRFLNDLSNIQDECLHNHAKVLGWLIANNRLEVKIGYVEVEDEIGIKPILHQKYGIMGDKEGNLIAFTGSNNESASGWVYNTECLTVFCSWKPGQKEYITDFSSKFEKFWNNKGNRTKVIPFPDAVKQNLISIAPRTEADLNKLLKIINPDEGEGGQDQEPTFTKPPKKLEVKLRDYQVKAVEAWKTNNCSGILEMATGTGKTITAVSAYENILNTEEKLILLVICPYSHLPAQWEKTIEMMDLPIKKYLRADGNTPEWSDTIYTEALRSFSSKQKRNLVILSTNDTASSPRFREMFDKIQAICNFPWMIICDEVHSIGSSTYRKALYPEYKYRLGLSATPDRYFDEEGSDFIREYFGKTVFQFSLREAIDTINPNTGVSYLVPYDYEVRFTSLTSTETTKYLEWTKKIIKLRNVIENGKCTKDDKDRLNFWYIQRQNIIKNAANKMTVLEGIILDLLEKNELDHLLIYCSDSDPEQLEKVKELLTTLSKKRQKLIKFRKYTSDESSRILKKDGYSERDLILHKFNDGDFEILLAMKCLDEGVDVPSTKTAVLMCSSGNPKEYIQRRGRILRPYPGKKKAVMYDIAAMPPTGVNGPYAKNLEEVVAKEQKRMEEFAKDSLNNPDIQQLIQTYQNDSQRKMK